MAQSPDTGAGDGDKAEPEARKSQDRSALDRNLPVVLAPRLGAGEDEAVEEEISASGAGADSAAALQSQRYLMLAATVAFAAAFGSFVGSVSGSGFAHVFFPAAPDAAVATAGDSLRGIKQQLGELTAIKASLDSASRSATGQFAKIADRLDRLDQRSSAAAETTGSIASATPAAAAAASQSPKSTDRVLTEWVVHDVQNGRALVESRNGGLFDIGAGSVLPGVGRVDSIKRQDGQWIVLTARGMITSGR